MARLFSFEGRLPRAGFWLASLCAGSAFAALFVALDAMLGYASTLLLYPPFFWLQGALLVRRLHDRGRSGRALFALAVPLAGPLWIALETGLRRGQSGANRYGRDPGAPPDHLTIA